MEVDIEDEMGKSINHFVAGALAGTAEHCGMYPFDTIKTHIQAHRLERGMLETAKAINRSGGIVAFFRGIGAVITGAAPAHALYFATYEELKKILGGNKPGNHPIIFAISGATATLISDAVLTPMDTIKQKRQLSIKPYHNTIHCLRTVIKNEGVGALYAGFTTTILMNIPFHAIYFNVYELLRRVLVTTPDQYNPVAHFVAGGGAGMVASGLTNPLDVAKTRLQTQGELRALNTLCCEQKLQPSPPPTHYRGMWRTLKMIVKEEGVVKGLSRGIFPRMMFHCFSASILWTTYEYFKFILGAQDKELNK